MLYYEYYNGFVLRLPEVHVFVGESRVTTSLIGELFSSLLSTGHPIAGAHGGDRQRRRVDRIPGDAPFIRFPARVPSSLPTSRLSDTSESLHGEWRTNQKRASLGRKYPIRFLLSTARGRTGGVVFILGYEAAVVGLNAGGVCRDIHSPVSQAFKRLHLGLCASHR